MPIWIEWTVLAIVLGCWIAGFVLLSYGIVYAVVGHRHRKQGRTWVAEAADHLAIVKVLWGAGLFQTGALVASIMAALH